jgi:hypothetical protein
MSEQKLPWKTDYSNRNICKYVDVNRRIVKDLDEKCVGI